MAWNYALGIMQASALEAPPETGAHTTRARCTSVRSASRLDMAVGIVTPSAARSQGHLHHPRHHQAEAEHAAEAREAEEGDEEEERGGRSEKLMYAKILNSKRCSKKQC